MITQYTRINNQVADYLGELTDAAIVTKIFEWSESNRKKSKEQYLIDDNYWTDITQSDIAKVIRQSIRSVQRRLKKLIQIGIILVRRTGRRNFYCFNRAKLDEPLPAKVKKSRANKKKEEAKPTEPVKPVEAITPVIEETPPPQVKETIRERCERMEREEEKIKVVEAEVVEAPTQSSTLVRTDPILTPEDHTAIIPLGKYKVWNEECPDDFDIEEYQKAKHRFINQLAYDHRQMPWRISSTDLKPGVEDVIFNSNQQYYSIGNKGQTKNVYHIKKAVKKIEQGLKSGDQTTAIEAYDTLMNYAIDATPGLRGKVEKVKSAMRRKQIRTESQQIYTYHCPEPPAPSEPPVMDDYDYYEAQRREKEQEAERRAEEELEQKKEKEARAFEAQREFKQRSEGYRMRDYLFNKKEYYLSDERLGHEFAIRRIICQMNEKHPNFDKVFGPYLKQHPHITKRFSDEMEQKRIEHERNQAIAIAKRDAELKALAAKKQAANN